jgi:tripartite-type tricarboxylate transporter receptor subunit TctC
LLGSASSLTVAPALYKNVAFDPVKSFTPIIQMLRGAFILSVRSNLPVTDLKGLISYAKANPGKLNFGSSGNGSLHHLCIEMLESATGIKMTHVPYKGSPQNWMALNNGEVDLICDSMPNPIASLQSGRARAIAVTGDDRVSSMPQVPTFKEQGVPEVNIIFWYGFLAPAGTPAPIVDKLNAAFANVFRDPEVVQRYREQGIEMTTGKPEEFGTLVAREAKDWARIIKETGVQVD